jgi:hypothetical protein
MVGVERCQLEVELIGVWRRQGPSDPPAPHLETRRAHVQQVCNRRHTLAASFFLYFSTFRIFNPSAFNRWRETMSFIYTRYFSFAEQLRIENFI